MKEIAVMFLMGVAMNAPPSVTPTVSSASACYCELNCNLDRGLSLSEFCRAYGPGAEEQFIRADVNGDGLLSEAEFTVALQPKK